MNKQLILIPFVALAACAPESAPVSGNLDKLIQQRDSLKEVQVSVKDQLKVLEAQILALDSSVTYDAVTALELEPSAFSHTFDVLGTVQADKSLDLYPTGSGKVEAVHVKKGQQVTKGQLLVSLDTDVLESSKKELIKGLELAQTVYEKQRTLWLDEQIGSEIQYLQAKNNFESLEQKMVTLNEQIELSHVRAPFAGTIDEVYTKVGDLAAPQMPAIRLVNTTGSYVKADVPETYASQILAGTEAAIHFDMQSEPIPSEVVQVGQFIKDANRSFTINVSIPAEVGVKPNQIVHVSLTDYASDTALVVPSSLVQQDAQGKSFMYTLIKKGTYEEVVKNAVVTGASSNGYTEIKRGLEAGDRVVEKGSRSVREGQRVVVVQP